MKSSQPYLLRAYYQWIVDSELTPYILLMCDGLEIVQSVSERYIDNRRITLNISPFAVKNLSIGNLTIKFEASFMGVPQEVAIPILSILRIYARENGKGMIFNFEKTPITENDSNKFSPKVSSTISSKKKSHLEIVK